MPTDRNTGRKAKSEEIILISDDDEDPPKEFILISDDDDDDDDDPPTVEVGFKSCVWINRAELDLGGLFRLFGKKEAESHQGEGATLRGGA